MNIKTDRRYFNIIAVKNEAVSMRSVKENECKVIWDSLARNRIKLVNWNDEEAYNPFQLEALLVLYNDCLQPSCHIFSQSLSCLTVEATKMII